MVDERLAITDIDWTKRADIKRYASYQRRIFSNIKALKDADIALDTLVLPDHISVVLDPGDFDGTNLRRGVRLPQNPFLDPKVQGLPLPLASRRKKRFRNKKQLR